MAPTTPTPTQVPESGKPTTAVRSPGKARSGRGIRGREGAAGWLFVSPALIGLGIFLVVPIALAFWVSFRDWNGIGSPFESDSVGLDNYQTLVTESGVNQRDFGLSVRNNLYYVLGVVPAQTALAFFLAVVVNQKFLKGKSFFRTAFYFPSVTSSIAISLIFIFLFQRNGAINAVLGAMLPLDDTNWLDNANGIGHNVLGGLGVDTPPGTLAESSLLGVSYWEWMSGPSVTLLAIMILTTWTTTGTFMLIFLAGLQNIPVEVEEAAVVDGTSAWQRFRFVTLPMMRPTLFLVLTLGIIGTWQVFDQIFAISAGGPQKTTLTPAYLVYRSGFKDFAMGQAAAVAFLLFVLIIVFTLLQRRIVRGKED